MYIGLLFYVVHHACKLFIRKYKLAHLTYIMYLFCTTFMTILRTNASPSHFTCKIFELDMFHDFAITTIALEILEYSVLSRMRPSRMHLALYAFSFLSHSLLRLLCISKKKWARLPQQTLYVNTILVNA